MKTINPYLNFDGQAKEAFEHYRSILGGEFAVVMPMSGVDCEGLPLPENAGELMMHIALPYGDSVLMASDVVEGMGQKLAVGNNVSVSISVDSRDEADRIYAGLAEGGTAVMPMDDAFWGDYFGALIDKFGINWLINYSEKNA